MTSDSNDLLGSEVSSQCLVSGWKAIGTTTDAVTLDGDVVWVDGVGKVPTGASALWEGMAIPNTYFSKHIQYL